MQRNRAKHHARTRALQALYQWELASEQASEVLKQFLDNQEMDRVDIEHFQLLFNGISHDVDAIDAELVDALDRPLADLDPIERNVIRLAAYEMKHCPETPVRVLINEGLEINKRFGADQGHKYVNGVLDKVANKLRATEMQPRESK